MRERISFGNTMLNFFFGNAINRRVDERLDELLTGNTAFHFIDVDDKSAEKIISDFIVEQKEKDNNVLSIYDFVANLHLPASQIGMVLGKFEERDLVKEV